jgi:hypothetical protein
MRKKQGKDEGGESNVRMGQVEFVHQNGIQHNRYSVGFGYAQLLTGPSSIDSTSHTCRFGVRSMLGKIQHLIDDSSASRSFSTGTMIFRVGGRREAGEGMGALGPWGLGALEP